jgi:hypothetical protein
MEIFKVRRVWTEVFQALNENNFNPRILYSGITTYLSIVTLNVNGLNSPIKRHLLANWIKKEDPTICCLQEIHLMDRKKKWQRVKGWEENIPSQWPP